MMGRLSEVHRPGCGALNKQKYWVCRLRFIKRIEQTPYGVLIILDVKSVKGNLVMSRKGIFCLEGLWENDLTKPSTIQPLLAFLKQNIQIPYIYRDCGTINEFEFYLSKFGQKTYRNYPILYLAFHGEPGRIFISGNKTYAIPEIGRFLEGRCGGKIILIASCSVLNIDTRILKRFLRTSGALAVLGYTNDVDWMRSSTFEMLILSTLQENVFDGHGIPAITRKCRQLAKSFRHQDTAQNIQFRMVSQADLS